MSEPSSPPPSYPDTPVSPRTFSACGIAVGDGDHISQEDVRPDESCANDNEDAASCRSQTSGSTDDVEAQDNSEKKRPSLIVSLRRLSSGVSSRIPAHWKAGIHNERRNVHKIDDHPEGFPRFAAFMDSDENFLIARRYGWLHVRVMLYRQSELRELELTLQRFDKADQEEEETALRDHKTFMGGEHGEQRKELVQQIDDKLKEYDDIVMRARAMASLPKASTRNYTSVYNHIYNRAPLSDREQKNFMNDSDFAALVDPEEAVTLDSITEDCLSMMPCKLTRLIFSTPEQRASSNDQNLFLFSKKRINAFVRVTITFLAVALLMAPTIVLFKGNDNDNIKIAVIVVFTLGFSLALSLFTRARRAEVFAATAA